MNCPHKQRQGVRHLQDARLPLLPALKGLGGPAVLEGPAAGGYGPLEAIARNKVNAKKVITHWPDMLRVTGSLVTNQVRAYDLLRTFGREGHPSPLGQTFTEYGRIAKTPLLLAVVDPMDDTYRRQMHKQLTVRNPGISSPAASATARRAPSTRHNYRGVSRQFRRRSTHGRGTST